MALHVAAPGDLWSEEPTAHQPPREIEEAAKRSTRLPAILLWINVLPIARPGLVAAGVLIFLAGVRARVYSILVMTQPADGGPPLLAGFQSVQQFNWNALAAATVMSMIPPILLVLLFQRPVCRAHWPQGAQNEPCRSRRPQRRSGPERSHFRGLCPPYAIRVGASGLARPGSSPARLAAEFRTKGLPMAARPGRWVRIAFVRARPVRP